ncbi:hypothetical protein DOY81_009816 [Sarcophaga bullata]|nr:hypothetical protein DOY81_009816 [Sarcophaga bullata]
MVNENDHQQQNQQQTAKSLEETDKSLTDNFNDSNNKSENRDNLDTSKDTSGGDCSFELATSSKGKLNDLVADLCLNGHESTTGQKSQTTTTCGGAYGDYTNIRATLGPVGLNDSKFTTQTSAGGSNLGSSNEASYGSNISAATHNVQQQPPTQNSSFSFKHFLSSNNVPTAPSTTVTSLDPPAHSTSTTSSVSNATTSSRSLQTSTGARPKVPQSSSVSSTSISSLTVSGGNNDTQSSATKMKRSPRFSSFDSQGQFGRICRERDHFQEWNFPPNAGTMATNSTDYDRGSSYVPRSYSNYDMPRPQTSPRRRVGIGATTKDSRPNTFILNANQNPTTAAKLKFSSGKSFAGGAAAAAALPDFVQDHWMDSWYANDMHVNSPPSSPIPTFIEDLTDRAKLPEPAGLPSNSVGSPEESSINKQLSRLRSDNERLERELNETRFALSEQTLRANCWNDSLLIYQKRHKTETEESFVSNKKRTTAVQSHVAKLKQQVQQLTEEVEILRRENEIMRDEGAVGGYSVQGCDHSYTATAVSSTTRSPLATTSAAAETSAAAVVGSDINSMAGIRPSRQQQLSRDLRRAASNAEQNLKQLLAGVENLRQMRQTLKNLKHMLTTMLVLTYFQIF